nr:mitogen-activated protein kinase kinase 5 [Tanacetum cinerariifolium]
ITTVGFTPSRCDSSLFIYKQGDDTVLLLLYVDDIVLTASSDRLLQQIIASLHREFSVTDLGVLNYFLGSLQYLTFTRPDITYVVQQGTLDYGLQLFSSTIDSLIAYSDADCADLTLLIPPRQQIAVPLPLPPSNNHINFSELDRLNKIGNGNGGMIYEVLHRPTNTHFALKVIYMTNNEEVLRQIRREIEILRVVDNINVVKCHDWYDHAGEIQVLLEYMDFRSLEERQKGWASLMCAFGMTDPPQAPSTASTEFQDFVRCCLQIDPARRWTAA